MSEVEITFPGDRTYTVTCESEAYADYAKDLVRDLHDQGVTAYVLPETMSTSIELENLTQFIDNVYGKNSEGKPTEEDVKKLCNLTTAAKKAHNL